MKPIIMREGQKGVCLYGATENVGTIRWPRYKYGYWVKVYVAKRRKRDGQLTLRLDEKHSWRQDKEEARQQMVKHHRNMKRLPEQSATNDCVYTKGESILLHCAGG